MVNFYGFSPRKVYVTSFQNRRKQNITRYRYRNFSAQNILHKWRTPGTHQRWACGCLRHCTPRGGRPHSLEWEQHAQHYGHVKLFCQQTELQHCRDEQHFNPAARAVDEYFRVPFNLRPAALQVCIIQCASFLYFLGHFIKNQTEIDRFWQKNSFLLQSNFLKIFLFAHTVCM